MLSLPATLAVLHAELPN